MSELVFAKRSDLIDIADSIRNKAGLSDGLTFPGGFISGINSISESDGGTFETQEKTVAPTEEQQVITPDDGYDGLSSVTVDAISPTYVGDQVSRQVAKAIVPTRSSQIAVESGVYTTGDVTVDAIPSEYIVTTDATAIAEDIASGKTAYVNGIKVTGTHECESGSGGIDTSDATAVAEDIANGKTAYVNGEKITGTLIVQAHYDGEVGSEPDDSFGNDGDLYFVRGE